MIKAIFCCCILFLMVESAIDKDLIKVPVHLYPLRAILLNSNKGFGPVILTLHLPTEKYTMSSSSQLLKIPPLHQLPSGSMEDQAALLF
jgi:hypothetical protein